jgi:hypothetical protein
VRWLFRTYRILGQSIAHTHCAKLHGSAVGQAQSTQPTTLEIRFERPMIQARFP